MKAWNRFWHTLTLVLGLALIAGCSSPGVKELRGDEKGKIGGTGVESQDLIRVSDKIARGILSAPPIANAFKPPIVVLDPIINDTRFPVRKDIFLERIQSQLISKSAGKVTFLARERMAALEKEREMKRTGAVTTTSDPTLQEFKGADYVLTGKLSGLSTHTGEGVSDYILYTFQLIDARTSVIIWAGDDEIKKEAQSDAVYR
jgi:PBP1b-binding outer membrane lipoprotein LpoB